MTPRSLNLHTLSDLAHVNVQFFLTNMCFKHVHVSLLVIRMSKVSKVAKVGEGRFDNGWTREESSERWTREELSALQCRLSFTTCKVC